MWKNAHKIIIQLSNKFLINWPKWKQNSFQFFTAYEQSLSLFVRSFNFSHFGFRRRSGFCICDSDEFTNQRISVNLRTDKTLRWKKISKNMRSDDLTQMIRRQLHIDAHLPKLVKLWFPVMDVNDQSEISILALFAK